MSERVASCSCGQLRIVCEGEPIRASICHCFACQKRTGSAFAVQARWAPDRVRTEGAAKEWVRTGDDGGQITFRFCATCGSTVWYTIDRMPDVVAVPIGGFGDTTLPAPIYSVYEDRMHPWVKLPDGIEHMA